MNEDVIRWGVRLIETSSEPGSGITKHTFANGTEVYEPYDPLKGWDLDPNGEIFIDPQRN